MTLVAHGQTASEPQSPSDVPILSPLTSIDSPPVSNLYHTNPPESVFYTQVDALFLRLGNDGQRIVPCAEFFLDPGDTGVPLRNLADDRFRALPRMTVGQTNFDGHGWEATYFGLNNWQGTAQTPTDDGTQTSSLSTNLQSFEANYLAALEHLPALQILGGVRYVHFGERLELFDSENGFNSASTVTNDLFGGQIGTRYGIDWGRSNFSVTGKFGVFDNLISNREMSLVSGDLSSTRTSRPSFITDVGVMVGCQITSRMSARFGYQLLLLDEIVRASSQVDSNGPISAVSARDHALLHGPAVGIDFRF